MKSLLTDFSNTGHFIFLQSIKSYEVLYNVLDTNKNRHFHEKTSLIHSNLAETSRRLNIIAMSNNMHIKYIKMLTEKQFSQSVNEQLNYINKQASLSLP